MNTPRPLSLPRVRTLNAAIALMLLLTACGGGGGGADDSASTGSGPAASPSSSATTVGVQKPLPADPVVRLAQVKADVRASTVYIETDGTMVIPNGLTAVETSSGSRGTGFIMTSNGHVVTNSHVAVGQGLYTLTVEGRPRAINAELVAIAECEDLAVLRLVSGAPYPALSWSAETPRISLKVGAAGFPADVKTSGSPVLYTFTEGIINTDVAYQSNYWSSADVFFHSAQIYGGNSGGPLVELDTGTVVGVNYARKDNNRNLALSSTTSREIVDKMLAGQDVLSIGFSGEMFYKFLDAKGTAVGYGLINQAPGTAQSLAPVGVWVRGVAAGGKAKRTGVLPGDIITAVQGVRLDSGDTTMHTYCSAMRSNNPNAGRTVDLEIIRPKAGGVTCNGEINGRTMGVKGAPSTPCPESAPASTTTPAPGTATPSPAPAASSGATLLGQVGAPGATLNHQLTLQVAGGTITGAGYWSDGTGSISGQIGAGGAVTMTETIPYQGQVYTAHYTGQYNSTTRVMSGRINFMGLYDSWSVGPQ